MLNISFFILGILAVLIAAFLLTRKNPITAAFLLIVDFALFASMYALLDAEFAAISQIIVYAGAIMVVFIFVIMLLNIPENKLPFGKINFLEWFLIILGFLSALAFGTKIGQNIIAPSPAMSLSFSPFPASDNVGNIAALMFTSYLWPFEILSVLLTTAIIGAVVIIKKKEI